MIFKQLAKDTVIYGGSDFFAKLIAFFTFPMIAAALSPESFGALEVVLTTVALIGLFINCGLNNSVQRYYWDQETSVGKRPEIVSTGFFVLVIFSLIGFLVSVAIILQFLPKVENAGLKMSWIGLFSAAFAVIFNQWQSYLLDVMRLHFAPYKFFIVSILSRSLSAVMGMLVVVYWGMGLDGYLGINTLVVLTIIPLSLYFVRSDMIFAFNRESAVKLVQFGYPFIFAGLAFWLFSSMDRWMLAGMSSLNETGIYSIAVRFATVVMFVSTAFGMAWSPVAIKIKTDNPSGYKEIYSQVMFLILYVMLIIGGGLALFSGEILFLLMTEEYAPSALPLTVLCFGIILQATQQVTAIGISLERKTYLFARLAWITAGINLILNWVLIPVYGALGAAIATTFSYLVLTLSYLYFTQKLHPLPFDWTRLAMLSGLGLIVAVTAVCFNEFAFNVRTISIKLAVSFICLYIGWLVLPENKTKIINYVNAE